MVIILGSSILLGSKFSFIFNKMFSSLFLTISVLLVLCYSISSTYKSIQKETQIEFKKKQGIEMNSNAREPLLPKGWIYIQI